MKRKGTLRKLGAVLGSAALLALLGACSGGAPVETADGGSYSAERPRPASNGGTAAAESSRPETDPAQPAGSVAADESSRPPDPSDGGEAQPPAEQGRPDESASEPGTGKGVADEQSRPSDEGGSESAATDSSDRSSANEQNRPVDKSDDKAPENNDPSVNAESQRPVDSNQTENPSVDKQKSTDQEQQRPEDKSSNNSSNKSTQDNTPAPQTDEKNRPNDSSSKDNQTAKDKSSSDRTTNVSDEEKRPVQAPKWNGPDHSSEQSRTDGSLSGSGHYLITEHLRPGLYRSVGNIEYWERTSGKSGTEQDRIVRVKPSGPAVVEIKSSDVGFISKGSGIWKPVSGKTGSFKTEFGAGTYIVGVDIAPGRYRSLIGATRWEILSGFGGEKSDQIRGASPGKSVPVTVEIKATDKGFSSSGALWTKVE